MLRWLNLLRPRQNGRHVPDDIFKCIFLNKNVWILNTIRLKFVPKGPIPNNTALVQIMAWRRSGDTPLYGPMMAEVGDAYVRQSVSLNPYLYIQYIPRNMHTVFALLCFVVVIHWLIFPYPPGLLHWHCGNLTIAPVPAKQPWWIWINTSCEFIMNDCITTTKQSTTKPCAYLLGYTVLPRLHGNLIS